MGVLWCKVLDEEDDRSTIHLSPEWDIDNELIQEGYRLSLSEIRTLTACWTTIQTRDMCRNENPIPFYAFLRLFEYAPETLSMFFSPKEEKLLTAEQLQDHPLFMSHIRRLSNAFGMIISLLDDQYLCNQYLKNLEAFHYSLAGMKKDYLATYMKIFDDELERSLGALYSMEVKQAFRKLLTIIYGKLTLRLTI